MTQHLTAAEINDACESAFENSADIYDLRVFDFARLIEEKVSIREREACARLCEKQAADRFADYGTREHDTGATYYSGRAAEEYEARDEEDEACAAAIRARSNVEFSGEGKRSLTDSAGT